MKEIAIIGAGWYGCHIALVLKSAGFDVTLFESDENIFRGISGKFGIRLHVGPHYPRSEKTRKSCREGYAEFIKTYPELVVEHVYSIYGLGIRDADNEPPKIDLKIFREVGREIKNSREIDPTKWGYSHLQSAFDIEEPSILVGNLLREKFRTYLQDAGVKIICNFAVNKLERKGNKTIVMGNSCTGIFDYVVNTTSYQALLPSPEPSLPFNLDIVYQPCLALVYEDRLSKAISQPPFSFIVMDGWFPCIMPYIENNEDRDIAGSTDRKYILTHGKFTVMGSFKTVEGANACLAKINEELITNHVQPRCEAEMERHWPQFGARIPDSLERRFKCVGWKGAVLAKVKSNREFRSAITFARDGVVHIVPGKVSNIFDAGRETLALINHQNILHQGPYQYMKNGTLHDAVDEIPEAVDPTISNTCNLQTYVETANRLSVEEKVAQPKFGQGSLLQSETPIEWVANKNLAYTPERPIPDSFSFWSKTPKTGSITEINDYGHQRKASL